MAVVFRQAREIEYSGHASICGTQQSAVFEAYWNSSSRKF
jgi:hypothetical protein